MPYIEEMCTAGEVIEVEKYYSCRWNRSGGKRAEKREESSETQKKRNQKRAEKNLRRLMNANFKDGDFLVRLDFVNAPGGSEDMQPLIQKAVRDLRRYMKKEDQELKYIYVKEVGPRGGRHIHMIMSKCDTGLILKAWPHGGVHVDPLRSGGQYRRIASYFIKYAARTEETEGELVGKRWYASRNLIRPAVRKKVVSAFKFKRNIKNIKGYILDKETEVYGINECGFEYFAYQLIHVTDERDIKCSG